MILSFRHEITHKTKYSIIRFYAIEHPVFYNEDLDMNIEEGLDFILDHFEEPRFPRTISTKATGNKQVMVYSRDETLDYFRKASLEDCRISAFSKHEVDQVIPNLIFIDLDRVDALDETLFIFGRDLRAKPLVISTGNGFAMIQPIKMESWKNISQHGKDDEELAKLFLQFASRYLSNNKCDSGNHPSLRSCLVRVPASINSKNGKEVEIQTFWDGRRVDVHSLRFKEFVDELVQREERLKSKTRDFSSQEIPYIERLLQKKLTNGRKRTCNLVLLPYLLNVKKLPIHNVVLGLYNHFDGHITKQAIEDEAKRVLKKGILPYSLAKMKANDYELYDLVTKSTSMRDV